MSKNKKFLLQNKPLIVALGILLLFLLFASYCYLAKSVSKPEKSHRSEIIPPYMVDMFANEKSIKPPFDFAAIQQPQFSNRICSLTQYGGMGDGNTLNTKAFSNAITDCAKLGGGIVEVPEGRWLTGAIKLESNINLHLDKNATIVFSTNPSDYLPAVFSRYEGVEYYGYSPLIYASNANNVAITGSGKLDGQGNIWWPKNNMVATLSLYEMGLRNIPARERIFDNEKALLRPSFIQLENSNSILLEDFTITNSPMWTIHPLYSSNILMRNLKIQTPGLNTDGIAIDSSRNVLIEDSTVASGDDAIVIKSGRDLDGQRVNKPSENIIIRNSKISEGHAGLSLGSETSGNIRNVFAYNLEIENATFALRIKSAIGRGGIVENIWASNISAQRTNNDCIQLTSNYDVRAIPSNDALPTFRNVFLDHINCKKSSSSINIVGINNNPIENVKLNNISIGSKSAANIYNAKNIEMSDILINRKIKTNLPLYNLRNAQEINISQSSCPAELKNCIETTVR